MASITKKTIRGRTYFYARECKRVDGKPKIVWQKYLGRAEDIINALIHPSGAPPLPKPQEAIVTEFGAVAALYDLSKRLRLIEIIDQHVPKRGSGPTVGTYLLVAALNRCLAPCSKASIAKWFQDTALRRWVDIEARQLTSQRFWDNMDRVSNDAIEAIERDLTDHIVREFDLDVGKVLFDATNFFTFIDSFNERCTIAQRGKSKEGRKSLRIVGLALLVSADFSVPLLHGTYPGNQPDAPTFEGLTSRLVKRYRQIAQGTEHVTIVFDKGNNSQSNLEAVEGSPYHFIGSLVPTHHLALIEVPVDRFRSLDKEGLEGVSVYRTSKKVFGVDRTIVVTYNEKLFLAQSKTLLREIAKRHKLLWELQNRLRLRQEGKIKRGKPPTVAATRKKVKSWLTAQHMKDLFHVEIRTRKRLPVIEYRFDDQAWETLQKTLLGKTIIFTDNENWTDAEIVRGYRSQHHVETAFRIMKDTHHIALRPQHHWTDQKIEVHAFYCVLALMLCCLLQRELHRRGMGGSIPEILDELAKIREVGIVYPSERKDGAPAIQMTLSSLSQKQSALFDALDLDRYLDR